MSMVVIGVLFLFGFGGENLALPLRVVELSVLALVILWVPVALAVNRSRLSLLSPIALQSVGYTIFFVILALQLLAKPELDYRGLSEMLPQVLLLLCAGYSCLLFGYCSGLGNKLGTVVRARIGIPAYDISSRRLVLVLFALYAIGWAARLVLIATGSYFHTVATDFRFSDIGNLVGQVEWLCKLVFIFVLVRYFKSPHSWGSRTILVIVSLLEIGYALPSGGRQALVELIIFGVVVYGFTRRLISFRLVVIMAVFALVVFPMLANYRSIVQADYNAGRTLDIDYLVQNLSDTTQHFFSGGVESILSGFSQTTQRNADIISVALIVRDTPSVFDYEYGSTYLGLPFFFIPRVIWPGKPSSLTNFLVTERYFPGSDPYQAGVAAVSLFGEFYLNFGTVGVLIGMFLWGIILRMIFAYTLPDQTANPFDLVLYVFCASYFLWISQTAAVLITILRMWFVIYLVAWILTRQHGYRGPASHSR